MNDSSKQSLETLTVEQGYHIGMHFFSKLWFLIQRIVYKDYEDGMSEIFFTDICCADEYCAEWNKAVRRLTGTPKEKQRTFYLTLPQIFQCTLEYCKLHHNYYKDRLPYVLNFLESMEKEPDKYREEWNAWEEAIQYVKKCGINEHDFYWEEEPAWPYD